jgi:serine/threonine protein kinase/tetratricopeptide (TPR) repeat protein
MGHGQVVAAAGNEPERIRMTPELWQQVKNVLQSVLEVAPPERGAFLDQACDGDHGLRQEVESLLAADEGLPAEKKLSPEFLGDPALAVSFKIGLRPEGELWIGRWVGPYKIIEQIGIGGMGEVYRAVRDDEQYRREVAIKVVRAGQDSGLVISRFKNERQILAGLDHSNIARLLDGGTTEKGAPYFVMELIDGQPVGQYCDRQKLAVTERLKLFLQVCSAVQYAHQRLIIHRDIKPSNILVTAEGVPKLLDFGIAKIVDPSLQGNSAEHTMTMFRVLTPSYASPEQIKGEPISTASDVYSLGVVLYELLTGHHPYRSKSMTPPEMARATCEVEPERPSTVVARTLFVDKEGHPETITPETVSRVRDGSPDRLQKRLRGDLDNIVLMALRKEPQRRYSSVEQFAQDLQRHLEDIPVIARKDTLAYRTSKFVTRHKVGVALGVAVAITLCVALAVTVREARIAERHFNDVRKLANSLMFDVHDAIQDLPGSTPARKLLVERALQYLDSLAQEAGSDASLQRELAVAYEKVGRVQGGTAYGNLGDRPNAIKSFRKALAIRQALVSSRAATTEDRVALARSYALLGRLLLATEGPSSALDLTRKSVEILEPLQRADPSNPKVLAELQNSYDALGDLYSSDSAAAGMGMLTQAAEIHVKAADLGRARAKVFPNDGDVQTGLSIALFKVGDDLKKVGQRKESLSYYFQARDIFAKLVDENPNNATFKRFLAGTYSGIGDTQAWDGDLKGSLDSYSKVLDIMLRQASADPKNRQAKEDLAIAYQGIGYAYGGLGRVRDAMANLTSAKDITEKAIAADPQYEDGKQLLAYLDVYLGYVQQRNGADAAALSSYRNALSIWQPLATAAASDVDTTLRVASTEIRVGDLLAKSGHYDEATAAYQKALAGAEPLAKANAPNEWALYVVADASSGLGDIFAAQAKRRAQEDEQRAQEWSQARSWYERSAEAWRQVHNPGAMSPGGFDCGSPKHVLAALAGIR